LTESAFTRLLDAIVALPYLDATWWNIASELLRFAEENQPSGTSWDGLMPREPEGAVVVVSAAAQSALRSIATDASGGPQLSYATKQERETLREAALAQLADAPFDQAMNEAATAIGLADAIDVLIGETFMPWYKGEGELTVGPGTVFPIREHDPRRWLGEEPPNTRPSGQPHRQLLKTSRLQVATKDVAAYGYVLDFHSWDVLSDLGAHADLIAAVGQTNADLDEFDIRFPTTPGATYANHGPKDHQSHADLVCKLIAESGKRNAEILLLPEYGLSSTSRDLVLKKLSSAEKVPRLVVCGVSAGTDDHGYIVNDAIMIITTRDGVSREVNLPQKIHPAEVDGLSEHIRRGSEIRVFLAEGWTIATVICFDAMDAQIIGQLAEFGVNLLLVPALSAKTATLIGSATSLCYDSQAFVVVATGPARWVSTELPIFSPPEQRVEAAFGGPYATGDNTEKRSSAPDEDGDTRTNLWTFSYPTRTVTGDAVYNS
jgi:hypothetical protein